MTELLQSIHDSQTVYRLGWTLLHTLWLGACVAAAFAVVQVMLRRRSANARYVSGCVAMVMMVVLPVAAFFTMPRQTVSINVPAATLMVPVQGSATLVQPVETLPVLALEPPVTIAPSIITDASSPPPQRPPLLTRISSAVSPALPWIVLCWAGGVIVLALWQLGGWFAAERLKRLATKPGAHGVIDLVAQLASTMRVSRPVKVLESMLVRVPTVMGWLRPVILLPVGVATGLTGAQLEAILAHELAHIRRHDYLVNLLQSLAETLLFYHPGVWFISRRIRAERENCCDDIAIAAGAERVSYAESLLHLAQRSYQTRQGRPLPSATGIAATGKPSQLRSRIRRLLSPAEETTHLSRSWPITLMCLVALAVASGLLVDGKAEPPEPSTSMERVQSAPQAAGPERESSAEADKLAKSYAKKAMDLSQLGGDPFELADALTRALEFRQDDQVAGQLYVYLGGAYHRQTTKYTPEIWGRQRRIAAQAYLTGLRRVLRLDLPAELPQRDGYYGDGYVLEIPRATNRDYPTKEQRELASTRGAKLLEELVQLRQVLTGQVIHMYVRAPDALDELRTLVLEHLKSAEAAEQMVKAVRIYRTDPKASIPVIASLARVGQRLGKDAVQPARFMKVYDIGDSPIEIGFIPDADSIVLGQPLFLTFTVINRSDKPYTFVLGGDSRGSVRHNRFRITAVDADGRAVPDPYSYRNFGGQGGDVTLAPDQAYMERLYLGYWCAFEQPGLYVVTCKRTLKGRKANDPVMPVTTSFNLTIAPYDMGKLGKVIADLGKKVRHGHDQAIYEATLGLSEIHDERAIEHLAVSLTRGDGRNKTHAVKGLSRFNTPSATDALQVALMNPDHGVSNAVVAALMKTANADRAIDTLLKELANDDPQTRALAARALGASRSKRAFDPLVTALADTEPTVQHAAAEAIGALGDPRGIAVLSTTALELLK